jgi:hypothetical protein
MYDEENAERRARPAFEPVDQAGWPRGRRERRRRGKNFGHRVNRSSDLSL